MKMSGLLRVLCHSAIVGLVLESAAVASTIYIRLEALSDLQITIRDVYDRQAQQDVLTFGIIIDEYIRLIGSVKQAFTQRQKAFYSWHGAEQELLKRKGTQDKLLRQYALAEKLYGSLGAIRAVASSVEIRSNIQDHLVSGQSVWDTVL